MLSIFSLGVKTKKNYVFIFFFMSLIIPVLAQQNLFNVPSGDITKKGQAFFQHQVNANDVLQNNSTLTIGLGHQAEIGANLYGFDLQNKNHQWNLVRNQNNYEQPLNPQLLLNFQKSFTLNEQFHITLGTETGFSLSQRLLEDQFIYFNYATFIYTSKNEKTKWINGLYFGDKTFLGEGNNIGYMGGIEYSVSKRLKLSADAILGNNASSVAVIGPCYYVTNHFALSAGYQQAFKNSRSGQAIVFELTFL